MERRYITQEALLEEVEERREERDKKKDSRNSYHPQKASVAKHKRTEKKKNQSLDQI